MNITLPLSGLSIKSAGKEIVASGSVHSYSTDADIEIGISNLTFVFSFVNDDSRSQEALTEVVSATRLKLVLYNFSNPLGTGTTEPISIGNLNDRRLYIAFSVYGLGD